MDAPLFDPFPILETPRLVLRRPATTDTADIFIFRSDPEVMQYIPRPLAVTEADVLPVLEMVNGFIDKGEAINWVMVWKATGQVIGMIGYVRMQPQHQRAEVGYSLSRAWHRKGIMRKALLRVIDYGFEEMKLHSIEAVIDAENSASGGLLEAVGFTREAYFREDFLHNGVFRNSIHYGLLQSDKH
jgi:ribosomal-protein-alanine N-acetyltransferase